VNGRTVVSLAVSVVAAIWVLLNRGSGCGDTKTGSFGS
jgi:hypothetical protein